MKKLRPLYGAVQAKVDQSRKMLSEIGQLLIENTAAHEKYQDAYDEFELRNTRKSGELAILLYDSIAMRRNVIDSLSARQRMFDRQLSKLNLQLDSASSVIDLNNELLEMKVKKYKYFTNLLEYGSLLSAIMASVGFSNWYRIQQKMDQQLFKRVPNKNSPFYRKRRSKK